MKTIQCYRFEELKIIPTCVRKSEERSIYSQRIGSAGESVRNSQKRYENNLKRKIFDIQGHGEIS